MHRNRKPEHSKDHPVRSEWYPLISQKPTIKVQEEGQEETEQYIVIDITKQLLIVSESELGLMEVYQEYWPGFVLHMGDFGYLETLRLAGIDTFGKELNAEAVNAGFLQMTEAPPEFEPSKMAKEISTIHKDVQFNPDFFDAVTPKRTLLEKIKIAFKKLIGRI